jgi:hypothetical protein
VTRELHDATDMTFKCHNVRGATCYCSENATVSHSSHALVLMLTCFLSEGIIMFTLFQTSIKMVNGVHSQKMVWFLESTTMLITPQTAIA